MISGSFVSCVTILAMASLSEQPVLSDVSQALAESKMQNVHVSKSLGEAVQLNSDELQKASDRAADELRSLFELSSEEDVDPADLPEAAAGSGLPAIIDWFRANRAERRQRKQMQKEKKVEKEA